MTFDEYAAGAERGWLNQLAELYADAGVQTVA
jgi:hypothetical protein